MTNGRDIALYSARIADDKKADDIVIYDVRGITDVTDYFVLATAHARSQVRAIVESIKKDLKSLGINKMGQEGHESGSWVLIDYSDCVVHVFSPELREYYSLESLWGDAPKLNWKREKITDKALKALLERGNEAELLDGQATVIGSAEPEAPEPVPAVAEAVAEAAPPKPKKPRVRKPKAVVVETPAEPTAPAVEAAPAEKPKRKRKAAEPK